MISAMDAIAERHSVRAYTDEPIDQKDWEALERAALALSAQGGLTLRLVADDPSAFEGLKAHYGSFRNVRNFIVCGGPKADDLAERAGYYGEALVLYAQMLGLNTCWVALTYSKRAARRYLDEGDTLVAVICVGHGVSAGASHPVRSADELSHVVGEAPDWFTRGLWAAQLAPTALNQQRFLITYDAGTVSLRSQGGFFSDLDLGIVRRHFEIGAEPEDVTWV